MTSARVVLIASGVGLVVLVALALLQDVSVRRLIGWTWFLAIPIGVWLGLLKQRTEARLRRDHEMEMVKVIRKLDRMVTTVAEEWGEPQAVVREKLLAIVRQGK